MPPRTYAWCRAVRDADLSPSARLVGLILSTYVNGQGAAYPTRRELARAAGVSVSTVKRALRALADLDLVVVEGNGGRSRPNLYWIVQPVEKGSPVTSF